MPGFIDQDKWKSFLDDFTKRNQFRATKLEVLGESGAQEQEEYLPLIGVSLDPKGSAAGSVEIVLGGETTKDPRHIEHSIRKPARIAPISGSVSFEDGLGFEDEEGVKTLLIFERLTEIPERTSDTRGVVGKHQ